MSRDQVAAQAQYGPYWPVRVTGGLETGNGVLRDRRCNVSFVFDEGHVKYIQVWLYEGYDHANALEAARWLFSLFDREWNGVEVAGLSRQGSGRVGQEAFLSFVDEQLAPEPDLEGRLRRAHEVRVGNPKVSFRPRRQPLDSRLQGQIVYLGKFREFGVFLFQDRPDSPRSFESHRGVEFLR